MKDRSAMIAYPSRCVQRAAAATVAVMSDARLYYGDT